MDSRVARLIKRRRFRRAFVAVGLVGALCAGWTSASGALARTVDPRASIYQGKSDCAARNRKFTKIGLVVFSRTGDTVTTTFTLSGASANTNYDAYLYDGGCNTVSFLGTITTDGSGNGTGTYSTSVASPTTQFFGTVYNGVYNDTTIVHLH